MEPKAIIFWVSTIAIVVFCAYVNFTNLIETYGSGPPYYNRTTNMDKWQSPVLYLVLINAVSLVAIYVIYRFTLSKNNNN